jgi:hypothetical protein
VCLRDSAKRPGRGAPEAELVGAIGVSRARHAGHPVGYKDKNLMIYVELC